jgi:alpha-L-fucosidase
MALDIERGRSNVIESLPWQTDTCIGDWHYNRDVFDHHAYKSARTVVHTLIDVVSKNGNLLLNVPLRGDGTPDDDAIAVVEGIADWMQINQEAIHGTRPWKVMGEGPQMAGTEKTGGGNFNEDKQKTFTAEDVRFTTKGGALYAIIMDAPTTAVAIKSLGTAAKLLDGSVESITLLGSHEKLTWSQTAEALKIDAPKAVPNAIAVVFKIVCRN